MAQTLMQCTHSVGHTEGPMSKVIPKDRLEMRVALLDFKLPEQLQPPGNSVLG